MARKLTGSKSPSALTAAQKELLRKEEELRRKEEEIQKRIAKLPEELKEKREKQRKQQRMEVTTVAIGEYRNRINRQPGRSAMGQTPTRVLRSHRSQGKIKFLVLCMIFILLMLLLWRVMPA
jgi:chromosome segregation ATPase